MPRTIPTILVCLLLAGTGLATGCAANGANVRVSEPANTEARYFDESIQPTRHRAGGGRMHMAPAQDQSELVVGRNASFFDDNIQPSRRAEQRARARRSTPLVEQTPELRIGRDDQLGMGRPASHAANGGRLRGLR